MNTDASNDHNIKNSYMSISIDRGFNQMDIHMYGNLISVKKPLLYPVHCILFPCLMTWRNNASHIPLTARRITCSIGSVTLAMLGIADTVARVAAALLTIVIQRSTASFKPILLGALEGFSASFYFATFLQIENFSREKNFENSSREHIINHEGR